MPFLYLWCHSMTDNRLSFDLGLERDSNLGSLSLSIVDLVQITSNVLSNQNISFVCPFVLVEFLGDQSDEFLFRILRV